MLNKTYKLGILLSVGIFSFISFGSIALALNYNEGLYNSGIYSAITPTPDPTPIPTPTLNYGSGLYNSGLYSITIP